MPIKNVGISIPDGDKLPDGFNAAVENERLARHHKTGIKPSKEALHLEIINMGFTRWINAGIGRVNK